MNIYIVYELSSNLNNFDFALENCLFGEVKLTKNGDIDKLNIQNMELDLMQKEVFYFLMVVFVKM